MRFLSKSFCLLPCHRRLIQKTYLFNRNLPQLKPQILSRPLHTTLVKCHMLDARDPDHEKKEKKLMVQHQSLFDREREVTIVPENVKSKAELISINKATYKKAILKFNERGDKYKRGHVEFIYAAMDKMKEFNVNKDLGVYKMLLDVFPKEKMIVRTVWQSEFMHYPKQQQCAIDLLDQLEYNGITPDDDMGHQLLEIFGRESHVFRKYQRVMYWMPKFRNLNPYPIPFELPLDPVELAIIAMKRMCIDKESKVEVFQAEELEFARGNTFIVSGQSPTQQQLLTLHDVTKPVYVEGGFSVWLRDKQLYYFMLRCGITQRAMEYKEKELEQSEDYDSMFDFKMFEEEQSGLLIPPTIHEQDDGTVIAMCITGTSCKDSLMAWIEFLQKTNPLLESIPVIFTLRTPEDGILGVDSGEVPFPYVPSLPS